MMQLIERLRDRRRLLLSLAFCSAFAAFSGAYLAIDAVPLHVDQSQFLLKAAGIVRAYKTSGFQGAVNAIHQITEKPPGIEVLSAASMAVFGFARTSPMIGNILLHALTFAYVVYARSRLRRNEDDPSWLIMFGGLWFFSPYILGMTFNVFAETAVADVLVITYASYFLTTRTRSIAAQIMLGASIAIGLWLKQLYPLYVAPLAVLAVMDVFRAPMLLTRFIGPLAMTLILAGPLYYERADQYLRYATMLNKVGVAHTFPWRDQLFRLVEDVYGLGIFLVGFAAWSILRHPRDGWSKIATILCIGCLACIAFIMVQPNNTLRFAYPYFPLIVAILAIALPQGVGRPFMAGGTALFIASMFWLSFSSAIPKFGNEPGAYRFIPSHIAAHDANVGAYHVPMRYVDNVTPLLVEAIDRSATQLIVRVDGGDQQLNTELLRANLSLLGRSAVLYPGWLLDEVRKDVEPDTVLMIAPLQYDPQTNSAYRAPASIHRRFAQHE